ncbi:MAG: hypothetical protein HY016_04720 [Nitrosomonadales bacterium]|nr:hypothetical protein [Nitrosomonadales bacterium]
MGSSTTYSDSPPQEMWITPEDIVERRKFLEFSDTDIELLSEIHRHIESQSVDKFFIDLFYRHLSSFPALHKLLSDEATIGRLKAVQSRYFMRLTAGD